MGARQTALNALIACRKESAWSNGILKEYIVRDRLDRREAALATRLCYGVMQNSILLDFYLQQLLTGRIKDLHPVVHDILHVGIYQLYFMDKIPDSAAVNESVSMTRKYCAKLRYAPGLVNAVLRNAISKREQLKQPKTLWQKYSHPEALVEKLSGYVGKERLEGMLQANNTVAQTVIQVNTLRTTAQELVEILQKENVTAQMHSWLPDCLMIGATGNLEQLDSFRQGLYYVQDAAARLSVLCAEIAENSRVLDCCAAPGGKSFAAAIAMKNTGTLFSCDVHEHKIALLENGAERLGITNMHARCQDATCCVADWIESMDTVIADVPCSGYGIIRKKPDIRYKDPAAMLELPELQLAILRQQAQYVKPGGVLLYSTCTLVEAENEGVVEQFCRENPQFTTEILPLPEVFAQADAKKLLLVPGEYDTDGFFICRLRRAL